MVALLVPFLAARDGFEQFVGNLDALSFGKAHEFFRVFAGTRLFELLFCDAGNNIVNVHTNLHNVAPDMSERVSDELQGPSMDHAGRRL